MSVLLYMKICERRQIIINSIWEHEYRQSPTRDVADKKIKLYKEELAHLNKEAKKLERKSGY